jgi:hypothetical protein
MTHDTTDTSTPIKVPRLADLLARDEDPRPYLDAAGWESVCDAAEAHALWGDRTDPSEGISIEQQLSDRYATYTEPEGFAPSDDEDRRNIAITHAWRAQLRRGDVALAAIAPYAEPRVSRTLSDPVYVAVRQAWDAVFDLEERVKAVAEDTVTAVHKLHELAALVAGEELADELEFWSGRKDREAGA